MTNANAVLILTAVALLFSGAVTGFFMARIRLSEPDPPKYLRFAHLASYGQAPILLGIVVVLGFSGMSEGFNLATAIVLGCDEDPCRILNEALISILRRSPHAPIPAADVRLRSHWAGGLLSL